MGDPTLYFDEAGRLVMDDGLMRENWREAACSVCQEPIAWVLDLMSFSYDQGRYVMGHARCLWTREKFEREAEAAIASDAPEEGTG